MNKIFLLLLLSFYFPSWSQTNEELAAELDIIIEQQMQQNNIPGLSASIVKERQVVWMSSYGLANIDENIEVTNTTNFTLASISKLFTATACANLWENGILDIDADINNYLPFEVINPNHPEIPITTRQLLLHKSSLSDSESDLQLWDAPGDPIYSLPYFCENYFVEGGEFYTAGNWSNSAPGDAAYWYSNAGFTLLGLIVQEASNQAFNVYCREQLLEPLGMVNSGWFYSEVDSSNIAMPYNGSLQPYGYFSLPEYPSAMLKSSISELSRFLLAMTQEGSIDDQEIISPGTFNEMLPQSMTNGFGWWGLDTWYGDPEGEFWSHGGFMNGVRTQLNYYPESESGLIILTNGQGNYSSIQNALEDRMSLFSTAVSNPELTTAPELRIYPNPSSSEIQVEYSQNPSELTLYSADGSVELIIHSPSSQLALAVNHLDPGIYFVKAIWPRTSKVERLILLGE